MQQHPKRNAIAGEHSLLTVVSCGCAMQLDRGLPDYVVAADAFDVRRRHAWTPGSRFRMYFGGKKGGPTKRSGARLAACAQCCRWCTMAPFLTGFEMITGAAKHVCSCSSSHCAVGVLHSAGGVYYKGFVNTVKPAPLPNMSTPETVAAYDPWESVRVEWDVTARDEEKFQVLLAHCSGGPCITQEC
jgi:hypothetical protein